MMIKLTIMWKKVALITVEVPEGTNPMIGREESTNTIVLHDPKVSRTHARLLCSGEKNVFIRDLHSTFGTYVNDRKITAKHSLRDGDCLRFGDTTVQISISKWILKDNEDKTLGMVFCKNPKCRQIVSGNNFAYCPMCGTKLPKYSPG